MAGISPKFFQVAGVGKALTVKAFPSTIPFSRKKCESFIYRRLPFVCLSSRLSLRGGEICKMQYPAESRNEAGEYPASTVPNNERKKFNYNATFGLSEEQQTAIVKLFYYIYNTN